MKHSWLAFAVLAACTDHPAAPEAAVTQSLAVGPELDVLFVIDNSASTADKQAVFAADLPMLVAQLDALAGGRPDLHIGVVSTTVGIGVQDFAEAGCPSPALDDDGLLHNTPLVAAATTGSGSSGGCAAPTDRFISDVAAPDGSRVVNYTGTLEDTLACIAPLGTEGCGFEAPLEAIKRALDGSRPENAGFLRPGATLAIVILTDEDDASVADPTVFTLPAEDVGGESDFRVQPLFAYACDTPISAISAGTYTNCTVRTDSYLRDPAAYTEFLTTLDGPSQVVVTLLSGDPTSTIMTGPLSILGGVHEPLALEPSCTATINGNLAIGRPGIRLADFLAGFGSNGQFHSVCQADYGDALVAAATQMTGALNPCLSAQVAAIDPSRCSVDEVSTVGAIDVAGSSPLPACETTGGAAPCWSVVASPACTTPSRRALHVERAGSAAPSTYDRVTCTP